MWLLGTASAGEVAADIVRLKAGGQLRGTLERSRDHARQGIVVIETLNGTRVVLERRSVHSSERRADHVEEYFTTLRSLENTPEAHWDLAQWCAENSLKEYQEFHLRRLLDLQPGHVAAHQALGHRLHEGQWMTEDEFMAASGYVKHGNRYMTPQERSLLERTSEEAEREREWYRRIRLWKTWLVGRNSDRANEAMFELRRITDPLAVSGLQRNFAKEDDRGLRHLYASALSGIEGLDPIDPLVALFLVEPDYEVRYLALNSLSNRDHAEVLKRTLPFLRDKNNDVLRRAALLVKRVGDEGAVPTLIDALVTTHEYRIKVPDSSGAMSFGTDGSMRTPGQLPDELIGAIQAGQFPNGVIIRKPAEKPLRWRPVLIRRTYQNQEVLDALRAITRKDFGYEEGTWRLWWTAQKNTLPK